MAKGSMRNALVLLAAFMQSGCVGVRTLQVSGPEPDLTWEELSSNLAGKVAGVTLVSGELVRGMITNIQADSTSIRLTDSSHALTVSNDFIYSLSVPSGGIGLAGGVIGGLMEVAVAESQRKEGVDQFSNNVGRVLGYGGAGAFLGATLLGNLYAPKRYLLAPLPDRLDTITVDQSDLVTNSDSWLTVKKSGERTTYNKEVVRVIPRGRHLFIVRPVVKEEVR
jgi:hypothetical protein